MILSELILGVALLAGPAMASGLIFADTSLIDGSVLTKREDCPGCTEAFHMLANAAPVKELKEPTADVHRVEQAPQVKRADCARCDATYDDCMAKTCDAAPPSDPDACKQHCVHLTCALPENCGLCGYGCGTNREPPAAKALFVRQPFPQDTLTPTALPPLDTAAPTDTDAATLRPTLKARQNECDPEDSCTPKFDPPGKDKVHPRQDLKTVTPGDDVKTATPRPVRWQDSASISINPASTSIAPISTSIESASTSLNLASASTSPAVKARQNECDLEDSCTPEFDPPAKAGQLGTIRRLHDA